MAQTDVSRIQMVTALRDQTTFLPSGNQFDILRMWYPSGIYRRWKNGRIIDKHIGQILESKYASEKQVGTSGSKSKGQRKRAIVDLALEAYRDQKFDGAGQEQTAATMDEEFKKSAIVQLRAFIFAGHDTTSSLICYALYALQRDPVILKRIREEHERVLGPTTETAQNIRNDPHIVNKLEFTMAVIKEALRLWPPASSTRTGEAGHDIRDPKTGEILPGKDMLVSPVSLQA